MPESAINSSCSHAKDPFPPQRPYSNSWASCSDFVNTLTPAHHVKKRPSRSKAGVSHFQVSGSQMWSRMPWFLFFVVNVPNNLGERFIVRIGKHQHLNAQVGATATHTQTHTQCCLCLLSEYLFLSWFCSAQSEQCDTAKRGCPLYLSRQVQKYPFCRLLSCCHAQTLTLLIFSTSSNVLFHRLQPSAWTITWTITLDRREKEMAQWHKIVPNPISFTSDPTWHHQA